MGRPVVPRRPPRRRGDLSPLDRPSRRALPRRRVAQRAAGARPARFRNDRGERRRAAAARRRRLARNRDPRRGDGAARRPDDDVALLRERQRRAQPLRAARRPAGHENLERRESLRMILEAITEQLTETLRTKRLSLFGHAAERLVLQAPPKLPMGDLATPVADRPSAASAEL